MQDSISKMVCDLTGYVADRVSVVPRAPIEIQSNRLYDIKTPDGHWIAKQFLNADEYETSPRREFDGLHLASSIGIAPRPIHLAPHTDKSPPVVIYEYLDGEMWDRRKPSAAGLASLCEVWTRQHQLTRPDLWHSKGSERPLRDALYGIAMQIGVYRDWAAAHHTPGLAALDRVSLLVPRVETVISELDTLAAQMRFCRSDPRFANVIARPDGTLGLIDWEDCGLRDPAREVADLLLHANQEDLLTSEEWEPFLTPYLASCGDDPTFARRLSLYLAIFPIYWLAGLLNMGVRRISAAQPAQMSANGMQIDLRARRYLAHALAWPDGDFAAALADLDGISFFPA